MLVLSFNSSYSHSATVIASENHDPSNKASVLFDLMSHTLTGCVPLIMNSFDSLLRRHSDSGAGDHGETGIQTFVDQHKCGQRCALMELGAFKNAEEEE
jgi:hypothetical protein